MRNIAYLLTIIMSFGWSDNNQTSRVIELKNNSIIIGNQEIILGGKIVDDNNTSLRIHTETKLNNSVILGNTGIIIGR